MAGAPDMPAGPEAVNAHETPMSEYTIEEVDNAVSYLWTLSPEEAGIMSGEEVTATANWNSDFEGEAWVKVAAVNNCGVSEFSDSLMVIVSEAVGLFEESAEFGIEIMPNPNNGKFRLNMSSNNQQVVYLSVVNYLGQTIVQSESISLDGNYTSAYDLGTVEAGIYFVIVQNGKQRHVKKLVINK